jgi:hypothetical protein
MIIKTWKKLPYFVKTGIIIFPIVIILSIVIALMNLSLGLKTSFLLWMVMPSIIFEQIFETCCYAFSNNKFFNFLFILVFWFVIGALIGIVKLAIFRQKILDE